MIKKILLQIFLIIVTVILILNIQFDYNIYIGPTIGFIYVGTFAYKWLAPFLMWSTMKTITLYEKYVEKG